MVFLGIGLLIVSVVLYAITGEGDMIAGVPREDFPRVAAPLSVLIMVVAGFAQSGRGRLAQGVKAIGSWAAIGLVLIVLYAYRDELSDVRDRVVQELRPGSVQTLSQGAGGRGAVVKIRKGNDGHFIVKASVNGENIHMIVDTGASTVVLRPEDARRAGIKLNELRYTVEVETANGRGLAARVKLQRIALGTLFLEDVDALITRQGALQQSLLGMSFLSRLRSYEFSKNQLMLRS
jgi:aspartyl protease family protein